jgi:predicted phage terminase large subunit-like protein
VRQTNPARNRPATAPGVVISGAGERVTASAFAHAADILEHGVAAFGTPGALEQRIDPRTRQTPALDLIDAALVRLRNEPDARQILTMAPQEGKSVRVAGAFPTWWLKEVNPDARVVVASYGQTLATRNGRAIRQRITNNPWMGLRIAPDNGAVHEWTLAGHRGGVLSIGIGGGLTGRPAELLVIDDPIKDRTEADSEAYRQKVWDWWRDVGSARLAPGAPVVLILTRWHEDDLAGRLLADNEYGDWQVLNIPAQADHDPAKGETDVLGREPGEFMQSARGRTVEQWERRKREAGSRSWQALYQGRPSPAEGDLLKREWWMRYDQPLWIDRDNGSRWVPGVDGLNAEMIQSWDMTFKDTEGTDFVVGQVWLRRGIDVYLLDQVRGRMSFVETLQRFRSLTARWPQATLKLVEDKANGPAVISSLSHKIPGIVAEEPTGSKRARASATTPFAEAGNVWLPEDEIAPWIGDFIEEAAGFPTATHDDQVDAYSQAINRLLLNPLLNDTVYGEDDLDEELADYAISRY